MQQGEIYEIRWFTFDTFLCFGCEKQNTATDASQPHLAEEVFYRWFITADSHNYVENSHP